MLHLGIPLLVISYTTDNMFHKPRQKKMFIPRCKKGFGIDYKYVIHVVHPMMLGLTGIKSGNINSANFGRWFNVNRKWRIGHRFSSEVYVNNMRAGLQRSKQSFVTLWCSFCWQLCRFSIGRCYRHLARGIWFARRFRVNLDWACFAHFNSWWKKNKSVGLQQIWMNQWNLRTLCLGAQMRQPLDKIAYLVNGVLTYYCS